MKQRRAGLALAILAVCASSMVLFAQSKDDKKKDEAQKREIQSIVKSVDDLTAGQPAATVKLLVSRGADMSTYVMPDLIGVDGEPAASLLRQQGFRVSFVAQQASSGLPPGMIVRQTPPGGHQVQPGAAISLEVAR